MDTKKIIKIVLSAILAGIMIIMAGCTSSPSSTTKTSTTTTTSTTPIPPPTITITDPGSGVIPQIGNVTIKVATTFFALVDKMGWANSLGEGHIIYYMDATPPTTTGSPALTESGTYSVASATSHTWTNVGGGPHSFSVQLVNNDNTPLTPPVTATVNDTVIPEIGPPQVVILIPRSGANVTAGNLTVTIQTSNFNIVDKQGQANASHEGHVHYYLDVEAPTTPGQPAIPPSGDWAHVASDKYTFTNVTSGSHTIWVELVNNDHTPLEPAVVSKITINVTQ